MTGEQKLESIREQIVHVKMGLQTFITCPYCFHENTPVDEFLCCKLFTEASKALLDRMEKQEAIDFVSKVQDKVN